MADLPGTTNVTIYNDGEVYSAGVNSSNELLTKDTTSNTSLAGIKTQTDKLTFDGSNNLKVVDSSVSQLPEYTQNLFLTGKGFHVTTNTITISGTSEVALFYLTNPNGSGKLIRFTDLSLGLEKGASTVASEFRMYRDPTITLNGTSIGINKALKSQSASSVASAYYSPSASANGTLMKCFAQSLGLTIYPLMELEIMVEANEKMLITATPSVTGINHTVSVTWVEV